MNHLRKNLHKIPQNVTASMAFSESPEVAAPVLAPQTVRKLDGLEV